jgi:hypothetical protein
MPNKTVVGNLLERSTDNTTLLEIVTGARKGLMFILLVDHWEGKSSRRHGSDGAVKVASVDERGSCKRFLDGTASHGRNFICKTEP